MPNLQTYDPQMAQETTSAASDGETLLLHKGEKKLLHCEKGAKNDRNKVNTTRLTSRLQRCDPKKAEDTTFPASFVEILLLHKGEKQKLLHFQNNVSKDRPQATSSMPNLQTCDPHMAQETTAAASFGEKLLLHKGEKQKLLHC